MQDKKQNIGGNVMLTNFGKFCRKLRIDKGELLYDMAQRLKVSSAFLSKVENGKAKPPEEWKESIPSMYSLNEEQKEELCEYIDEARESSIINVSAFSRDDRDRKSTRLNSSHRSQSRMPSSA